MYNRFNSVHNSILQKNRSFVNADIKDKELLNKILV